MSSSTSYTPNDIVIRNWRKKDRNVAVEFITVSGMPMSKSVDSQGNTLVHWRLGCAWDGRECSVAIDTRILDDDPVIELEFVSKNYFIPTSAVCNIVFSAAKQFTSTDVLSLITEHGFHRYLYDGNGSGCLHWCKKVICILEEEGLIGCGSLQKFDEEVAETETRQGLWVPNGIGSFF